jgi:probable F420-dependent oxidoreductase
MRVLSALPQYDLTEVPTAARAAEEAGYDGLLTMENQHEPFLALAVAAVNTRRVALGTAVAIAFPRSPMVVANAAWDLQIASRGRFVLGLGPQIRAHNERRFSVPWGPPAPRLREYVKALRAIWRAWEQGTPLRFEGQHYRFTLMTPNFTPRSTGQPMVPVTIAAVGPHSLRLAGEVADGARLHGFCTRKYLDEAVLPRLEEGMRASGRARERFEITGGGFIATGPDRAAVARAFEWVRYRVAFYASTPAYWPVLAVHGLEDLGAKLNTMTKAGQWDKIAAEVPDDVALLFAAVGTHAEIAAAIERRFGGAVDGIYARAGDGDPALLPPDLVQDIRRISSPFAGHRTTWDG